MDIKYEFSDPFSMGAWVGTMVKEINKEFGNIRSARKHLDCLDQGEMSELMDSAYTAVAGWSKVEAKASDIIAELSKYCLQGDEGHFLYWYSVLTNYYRLRWLVRRVQSQIDNLIDRTFDVFHDRFGDVPVDMTLETVYSGDASEEHY